MYSFDYYPGYYNNYRGPSIGSAEILIIVALGLLMLFVLAIALVFYLFQAIALYKIAKNRGKKNAFLAFIPFANSYYLGSIGDDINATMGKTSTYARKILTFMIAGFASDFVAGISGSVMRMTKSVLWLAPMVLLYIAGIAFTITMAVYVYISMYKIYNEYDQKNATLFIVLSVLFNIHPFLLFAIRNKKSGYQIWQEQQASIYAANAAAAAEELVAEEPTIEQISSDEQQSEE